MFPRIMSCFLNHSFTTVSDSISIASSNYLLHSFVGGLFTYLFIHLFLLRKQIYWEIERKKDLLPPGLPHRLKVPRSCAILHCFPKQQSDSWTESGAVRTWTSAHMGPWLMQSEETRTPATRLCAGVTNNFLKTLTPSDWGLWFQFRE